MPSPKPRVMMVSSEASPWAKTGGLADVVAALPVALAQLGHAVSIVIPRYMDAPNAAAVRVIDNLPIPLGPHTYPISVFALQHAGVSVFFVDQPGLYARPGLYGDVHGDFGDNHVRFALLSKAALEISRRIFHADIFHCHDWQAGLLPVYLTQSAAVDPAFLGVRSLLTIHNLGYQGNFPAARLADVSLPRSLFHPGALEFWGDLSYLKAGIVFSDALTTVSPTYAQEIQTPEYGFRMDGLLRQRASVLTGIINGVDYLRWDPQTDPALPAHYSPTDLAGKQECKRALLAEMGLPASAMSKPLLGIVSRFASQKGFDLIADIAPELFGHDIALIALGNGEPRYEALFQSLTRDYPEKAALHIGYDDALAHRIEAAADIFLMPSLYEPCGLNQIYSLRYGTVPVVRATGGLEDSIDPSTGFKFVEYNGTALLAAIRDACIAWQDRPAWQAMMVRGMLKDFSWAASAAEYSRLYGALHPAAA